MKNCNSTLTTIEVDEPCRYKYCNHRNCLAITDPYDPGAFNWHKVTRMEYTCGWHDDEANFPHEKENVAWTDETHGAKPHTPLVSAEEVETARNVYQRHVKYPHSLDTDALSKTLEYFAKRRQQ